MLEERDLLVHQGPGDFPESWVVQENEGQQVSLEGGVWLVELDPKGHPGQKVILEGTGLQEIL